MTIGKAAPVLPMRFAGPLLASAIAFALLLLIVRLEGIEPGAAIEVFLHGIAGTTWNLAEVGVAATPLVLCGLAAALAFQAGLFNIGAEGQLLAGMIAATAVGVRSLPVALGLVLAALAGAVVAGVAGLLRDARRVPEVLSTLLLNFVLLHGVALAVQTVLREPGSDLPQSAPLADASRLATLVPATRLHVGFLVAVFTAVALHVLLQRTAFGLRIRAAGGAPRAAAIAGFPVRRDLFVALSISGALAGLAGGIEITGVTGRLYENPSPGFGYTAIAVALLGRNAPRTVLVAAVLFGALDTGCLALSRELGATRGLSQIVESAAILTFLLVESRPVRRFLSDRLAARRTSSAVRTRSEEA